MRPAAKVLMTYTDRQTYMCDEIIAASAVYSVVYRGNPINIKSSHTLNPDNNSKYKKTMFVNPGPAHALAERLNHRFNTKDFAVYKLLGGEIVVKE